LNNFHKNQDKSRQQSEKAETQRKWDLLCCIPHHRSIERKIQKMGSTVYGWLMCWQAGPPHPAYGPTDWQVKADQPTQKLSGLWPGPSGPDFLPYSQSTSH